MNNNRIKETYVACSTTIQGLKSIGEVDYNGVALYTYENPRDGLTEEQKIIQAQYKWKTNQSGRMRLGRDSLEQIAEGIVDKIVLSKYREDLYSKVLEEMNKTKIYLCASLDYGYDENGKMVGEVFPDTFTDYTLKDKYSEQEAVLIHGKVDELEDKLDKIKMRGGYGNDMNKVYLERFRIMYDSYDQRHLEEIPKIVKRVIAKNLTYCLKGGKNIIPDEYLDKGKAGIEEWQASKRSANKNNSMEKKMLRDCVRAKKESLDTHIHNVTRKMIMNQDWSFPTLAVNGMYNQAYMRKLVMEFLKDKDNQAIIQLEESTMLEMAKNYWKKQLEEAIKRVDSVTLE